MKKFGTLISARLLAVWAVRTIGTRFKGYLNADRVYNKHEKSDDMKYIVVRKNEELACSIKNRYRISATGEATVGTAAVCRIK